MYENKNLCFVIMPFDPEGPSGKVWSHVIRGSVFAPGSELSDRYRCVRADEILGSRPIMADVREHIARADLVIADLTGSNANVYFELGIVQELNKPFVILASKDEQLPFDVSHLRHIQYSSDAEGLSRLTKQLTDTINDLLTENLERDFGISQTMALERERVAIAKRQEGLQQRYVSIPKSLKVEYGDIPEGSLLRLHPSRDMANIGKPLEGSYYSFLKDTHHYGYGSDISFRDGHLRVGFGGWDYGYFLELGPVPFSRFLQSTSAFPDWLDQGFADAWSYIFTHVPPTDEETVRRIQSASSSGLKLGGVVVRRTCDPVIDHSYLLRSVCYRNWDILVALHVVSELSDGSLVLAWRLLATFPTPDG